MDLAEAFRNYREKIVDQWVDYTLSTYTSSAFFKREKDNFSNPIGGTIRSALDSLFVLLAKNADPEEFKAPVAKLVNLRAVQEFTPAQAIAPLNAVKHITRNILAGDKERSVFIKDLYDFDFAVDLAVLAAFDIYMEARERLCQVRIAEIKSGNSLLTNSKCPSRLIKDDSKDFLK